jgi:hypothetical protein
LIDHRIYYDQGTNTWIEIDSGIVPNTYTTALSLVEGTIYSFKVQARNSVGLGELSQAVAILAAQIPDKPLAPTTSINGDNVSVTWELPSIRGSPITDYLIRFRESDLVSFTEYKATCDGNQTDVTTARSCYIPIAALRSAPYNLAWGDSVHAIVSATNFYGTSVDSEEGSGAIILTVPSAPVNLQNVQELTTSTEIGLTWQDGFENGGTDIIDYTIWSDLTTGVFMPIASGVQAQSYLH